MSLYGLTRNFYSYLSDDGTNYQVAITTDDATAGSFGTAITPNSLPILPRGWRMRKMYGVSSGGVRTKTPMASPSQGDWVTPSTFTKKGTSFNAQGAIGERRTTKS